eukprot:TRINITY_DN56765_c0_g1_i1.p1 TRINITY_DN56765_c0_g1~~TRINITY_DN56765_c0_g1_i1.p1  ORF type:complete len:530 (+),score=52.52 TRINITY_DN56765_c0_g1_i1:86-1675(+)
MELVGAEARIQFLQAKPELNGLLVTVLSYEAEKGRYAVSGERIQRPILLQGKNLNVVESDDQSLLHAQQLVGKHVVIENLESKPEWNGRSGVVQSHCSESSQFAVLIDGVNEAKMLKKKNVREEPQEKTASQKASQLIPGLASSMADIFSAKPADMASKLCHSATLAQEVESFKSRSKHNECKIEDVLALDMPVFSNHGCPACLAAYMYVYAGTIDLVELYYEREILKGLCSYQEHNLKERAKRGCQPTSAAWRVPGGNRSELGSVGELLFREWVSATMLEEPKSQSPNFAALKELLCTTRYQADIIVGALLVAAGDYLSPPASELFCYDHEFCLIRLRGSVYLVDAFLANPSVRKDPGALGGFWRREGVPKVRKVNDVDSFLSTLQDFLNQPDDPAALAGMFGIDNYHGSPIEKSKALKLATRVHQGKWTSTQTRCFEKMFHVDFSKEFETGAAEHAPLLIWRSSPINHSVAQSRYEQLIRSAKTADDLHKQHCGNAEARFQKLSFEDRFQEYSRCTESVQLSDYTFI